MQAMRWLCVVIAVWTVAAPVSWGQATTRSGRSARTGTAPAGTPETRPAVTPVKAPETAPAKAPASAPAATQAGAPATRPAAAPVASAPEPATGPSPTPLAAPAVRPAQPRNFSFHYRGDSFTEIIKSFAQEANRPLLGEPYVDGTLTFFDSEMYTFDEALDLLNLFLAPRGVHLRADGRYLRVEPAQTAQHPIKQEDQIDANHRPMEIVTVVIPLKYASVQTIEKATVRMVTPPYGQLVALPRGKGLVITETAARIAYIRSFIELLDTERLTDWKVQTYKLKFAGAAEVSRSIDKLFGYQSVIQRARGAGREGAIPQSELDYVVTSADSRSNTLFLTGSGDALVKAEAMVQSLDKEPETSEINVYQVKSAKADDVVRQVQPGIALRWIQAEGQPPRSEPTVRLVADSAANRIILSGSIEQIANVKKMIEAMDVEAVGGGMKIFALKFADAQQLAAILTNTMNRPTMQGRRGATASVTAEPRGNQLIVMGTPGDVDTIDKLVQELDKAPSVKEANEARQIEVVQLEAGNARELAGSLMRLFAERMGGQPSATGLRVEAPTTDSVIISALPTDWPAIRKILDDLKANVTPGAVPVTRQVPVQFVKASDLAGALRPIFDSRRASMNRGQMQQVPVVISPSPSNSALLISATKDDQELIASLVKDMDVEGGAVDPVRTVYLTAADPEKVATKLRAMLPPSRGQEPDVSIQADRLAKCVWVRAPEGKRKMVEDLIQKLDEASKDWVREMRQVELKNASAAAIVATLSQLYPDAVSGARGGGRGPADPAEQIVLAAAPGDRVILVEAPKLRIEELVKLAQDMDTPGGGSLTVRTYQLDHSAAPDVARTLGRLYTENVRRPTAATELQPKFEADAATNQVIVAATESQFKDIEPLIKQIQNAPIVAGRTETFFLKFARSMDLAPVLQTMLADSGTQRAGVAASAAGVRVAALPGPNAIVVQGLKDKLDLAKDLIERFDKPDMESDKPVIRVYQLTGSSAQEAAGSLGRLFAQQQGRAQRGAAPEVPPRFEFNSAANQLIVAATESQFKDITPLIEKISEAQLDSQTKTIPLRFAQAGEAASVLQAMLADSRAGRGPVQAPARVAAMPGTNAVIVQGPADKIALAEELLKAMDKEDPAGGTLVRIISLDNAPADAVANALRASLPPPVRGAQQDVSIQAEPRSNTILLRAPEAQRKTLETLIAEMDKAATQAREVRIVRLEHVSAAAISVTLNQMYGAGVGVRARPGDDRSRVVITATPDDRSLVLDAPRAVVEPIVKMARDLDTQDGAAALVVRTYAITSASAPEIAQSLQRLFAPVPGPVAAGRPAARFEADYSTNQLRVAASPSQFDEIERVIKDIEAAPGGQIKHYDLKVAKASELLPILQAMLSPDPRLRGSGALGPRVAVAPGGNTLIVQGTVDKLAMADKLVEKFDTDAYASALQIVALKNAQADTLAREITDTLSSRTRGPDSGPQVTVTAEMNSNSLLVRGPASELPGVLEMIRKVDAESTPGDLKVQLYPLKNADATEMSKSIGKFAQDTIQQQARARKGGQAPPFTVTADTRTNTLVVCTTVGNFALVESLVQQLDANESVPTVGMEYYPLVTADATDVAAKINASPLFAARRPADKPTVEADTWSNAVTVIAKDEDLKEIEHVIGRMEKFASLQVNVKLVPTPKIRADKMAELVRRLYGQTNAGEVQIIDQGRGQEAGEGVLFPSLLRDSNSDMPASRASSKPSLFASSSAPASEPGGEGMPQRLPVKIVVDRDAKALIVSGTRTDIANIESLVDKLSTSGVDAEADFHIYVLKKADPASVARTLDDLFNPRSRTPSIQQLLQAPQQPGGRGGRRGGVQVQMNPDAMAAMANALPAPPSISVVADPTTKSIIVRAKQIDLDMIEPLIKHLDQPAVVVSEFRVFALKNTDATEVAANLRELFQIAARQQGRGMGGSPFGPQQQRVDMILQLMELPGPDGASQVDMSSNVSITANRQTNSVVVAAPDKAIELVAKIIQELDQNDSAVFVKLYTLKNADVRSTVQNLQDIFVQGGVSAVGGGGRGARGAMGSGAGVQSQRIIITGDEMGRRVIVAATADKHELIAQVIREIDSEEGVGKIVEVYRLTSSDARSVAAALQTSMSDQGGAAPGGRGGARGVGASSSVVITADASSNSIVASATKEGHAKIAEIIAKLDVPVLSTQVRVIPLTRADPAEVAQTLRNVFAAGGTGAGGARAARGMGAAAGGAGGAQSVTIEPGPKSLLVRAPDDKTFQDIRDLVAKLDTGQAGLERVVIPLKNAQAATVAASITQAFAVQRGRVATSDDLVTASAETSVNAVVVTASAENLKKIQDLVAQLDNETTGRRTEMIALKNAKAADVATMLSKVAPPQGGARGQQGVTVSGDAGTNTLVIAGPAGDVDKLMALVMQIDQLGGGGDGTSTYVVPLQNGYASDVAKMVQNLYQPLVQAAQRDRRSIDTLAVTADDRANALVLATTPAMYERVLKWVQEVEDLKRPGKIHIINVQYADPADVQAAINKLLGGHGDFLIESSEAAPPARGTRGAPSGAPRGTPPSPRSGAGAPGGGAATPGGGGAVLTSPRSGGAPSSGGGAAGAASTVLPNQRAIMVDVSDEEYEAIQQLVAQMEAAAIKARRQNQVFTIKNNTNVRVADAITRAYAAARSNRPEDQVTATAVAQSDVLLVTASKEKLEEITKLVELLDKAEMSTKLETRTFAVTNTQPTKILPLLRTALTQMRLNLPGEPLEIQADERTKSLVVTARGTLFDPIEALIKSLDKPTPKDIENVDVLVVPLKKADAARLATVLTAMLTPTATGQLTAEARALQEQIRLLRVHTIDGVLIPDLDLSKPIKVVPDPGVTGQQGSNSLLITSTVDNLKAMQAIVELLDMAPLAESAKVRLVHLKNANANTVTTILREIYTQGARLGGKTGTSVVGRAEPESAVGKALVNPLNVSADLRTNMVVLSGSEESVALAEVLCKDLDKENGKVVTEVRCFRLKNADATRLMPVLQAVFAEGPPAPGQEGLTTQVTRLRTVLEKRDVQTTEIPKTRDALVIRADQTTNILVVAARSDVLPLIADVIATMDVAGAGSLNAVRIFPLANADATRLQQVLNSLYTGPNAQYIRIEDKPTVGVDTRTNALVVSASDNTFAVLDLLLKSLDAKTPIDLRDIQVVPLKNADAATLGASLQKMMDARVQRLSTLGVKDSESMRVLIAPDARSNALIVAGSKESFGIVKDMAQQLDDASPALSGQVQIYPLKQGNAGSISQSLANLFNQRYAAARTTDVQKQKPVILPDVRTNSLLVSATQDDSKILEELVAKLDVKLENPSVLLEVILLKHNDVATVGTELRTLFAARLTSMTPPGITPAPQDRVDISTDALSNALVVSASKENLDLIRGLLEKVDVEPPVDSGLVQMFPLKNADATRVSTMLQTLLTKGLYKPALVTAGSTPAMQAREKVSIAVDTRTNTLIVSASKENLAILKEIIAKADGDAVNVFSDIKVFTLKNADASRLAPSLQQFFTAKRAAQVAAGDTGRSLAVSITPDPRTNSILVAGSKEDFASLETMLAQLDTKDVLTASEFRVFQLKHATATVVQPQLTAVFTNRPTRGGLPKDPVTLVADRQANTLIVSANPEDMKMVEALIAQMDVEQTEFTKTQVFALRKADATQVATTIRSLYQAAGGAGAGAAAATPVTVSVDERLNAVVVTAGETDLKRVDELVRQLDNDTVTKITEIRVFTLANADATEMATILTDVLTNKLKAPTALSPNRQMIYQQIAKTKEGKDLVVSGLHEGLLISPDRRTNSLVVAAPADSMPLLEAIIRNMDSTAPRAAEIRTFQLQNADATQMATVLTSLFGLTTAAAAAGNPRATSYTLVTSQPAGGEGAVTVNAGTAEQYSLRVTVDARTNTLLVGGTKQYVELCARVIEDLDSSPQQERVTQVYRLRNTRATDIQTAVKAFVDQERAMITSILGADKIGAVQRMLDNEIAVVAVASDGVAANGNTLLLTASPRYFKMLSDMIQELDQPPPQVLVQVLLADVTLTDETDLGMEWSYTKTHDDTTYKTGTNFGVAAQFAKSGGFDISITGSQVSFFLQALQSSDRLEVLSAPQILATDNQTAHIQIGQSVPYVTNSSISTVNNNIVNTVAYKDVGVILDVTPRISPDGLVKLLVAPQVSSVSNSTVPLSSGVSAAIFNQITSTTTITVQDGHTIILGGLITTTDEDTVKKVPVLGDVPLLGNLFRSTIKTKNRHELLIILTPRIINKVSVGDTITQEEKTKLKLIEGRERDAVKDTIFTPLERLAPGAKGTATQPSAKEQLVPEWKDSPAKAPASAPAPAPPEDDEAYE